MNYNSDFGNEYIQDIVYMADRSKQNQLFYRKTEEPFDFFGDGF